MKSFNIPILFIVFNRPDTTSEVLNEIRKIKPQFLYIASDGPRNQNLDEIKRCEAVREIIKNGITWECEVIRLYQTKNLGCGKAVSTAITWFFQHVEQGIILEDDCVPNTSFFSFCKEMLEKYKYNENIYSITGQNIQFGRNYNNDSYFYSKYLYIWGWATWRRAWEKYDFDMQDWPEFKEKKLDVVLNYKVDQIEYWKKNLDAFYKNEVDSWDYQFLFTIWKNSALTIVPNKNLISNIGFREDATHTVTSNHRLSNLPTFELSNISHPKNIVINTKADDYFFYNVLNYSHTTNLFLKILRKLKIYLKNIHVNALRNSNTCL
ncbi:nucleotide-diphospho-sugar transferase [Spirosoma validum]|uniref:Nucleotide-diphospho-sugar transferase n=1 Tax=Spirosoma validum TaxID=2771355 RepID=A0A927B132_9BACT|nr:nucleotide-diphospho-sugar transferase [Spirosoma validum]MBD2753317.1 nucleotide-diphospho-sugar transferase [Spirosoma validum]